MAKNDMNKVILIGNLTRDMEISYTSAGMAIGSFSIANNRSVKRNDQWESEASYLDVTVFGKMAESLKQYLVKGKSVAVEGILKQDRWEKDGQKHSRVRIIAESLQLLGGRDDNSNQSQGNSNNNYNNNANQNQAYNTNPSYSQPQMPADDMSFSEDIPF